MFDFDHIFFPYHLTTGIKLKCVNNKQVPRVAFPLNNKQQVVGLLPYAQDSRQITLKPSFYP